MPKRGICSVNGRHSLQERVSNQTEAIDALDTPIRHRESLRRKPVSPACRITNCDEGSKQSLRKQFLNHAVGIVPQVNASHSGGS
jgi:hypothetical protein